MRLLCSWFCPQLQSFERGTTWSYILWQKLTEDKKLEGRGLGESKLKIENRGLLGVSSNDIEAMERGCRLHAARGKREIRRLRNSEIDAGLILLLLLPAVSTGKSCQPRKKIWRQGCEHSRCIIVLRPKFPTFQYKFAALPEGLQYFSFLRGGRDSRYRGTIQVRCRVIQLFVFLV